MFNKKKDMVYATVSTRFDTALRLMLVYVMYTGEKPTSTSLSDFLRRMDGIYAQRLAFVVTYDARRLHNVPLKYYIRQRDHMRKLEIQNDCTLKRFAVISPKKMQSLVSTMTSSRLPHRVFKHDTPVDQINTFLHAS